MKPNTYTLKLTRPVYLGIWQLKDLKDAMSRADAAGSNELLAPNLGLADAAEASESMTSLGPLEKGAM
jgi:hypothetical protein